VEGGLELRRCKVRSISICYYSTGGHGEVLAL